MTLDDLEALTIILARAPVTPVEARWVNELIQRERVRIAAAEVEKQQADGDGG
jgi:type II secretory pathway component PulM